MFDSEPVMPFTRDAVLAIHGDYARLSPWYDIYITRSERGRVDDLKPYEQAIVGYRLLVEVAQASKPAFHLGITHAVGTDRRQ